VSVFRIGFAEEAEDDEERAGRIVIGDFEEGFLAETGFWSAEEYRRQWLEGARRLVAGAERSCFVTCARKPAPEDFFEWWTVYRRGAEAVFHNQYPHFDALGRSFSYALLYDFVPPCAAEVSEWIVDVDAIARFVRDHGG
jgi:hypothetical protein